MSRLDVTLKEMTKRFGDGTVEASNGMNLRGRYEWEKWLKEEFYIMALKLAVCTE